VQEEKAEERERKAGERSGQEGKRKGEGEVKGVEETSVCIFKFPLQ